MSRLFLTFSAESGTFHLNECKMLLTRLNQESQKDDPSTALTAGFKDKKD
jgi:hypothetical protein